MKKVEMVFEWQWNNEEIEMLDKLNRIKEKYAKMVIKFAEKLPASMQRLAIHEACDPSCAIFMEGGQMDKKFRTKVKEIKCPSKK